MTWIYIGALKVSTTENNNINAGDNESIGQSPSLVQPSWFTVVAAIGWSPSSVIIVLFKHIYIVSGFNFLLPLAVSLRLQVFTCLDPFSFCGDSRNLRDVISWITWLKHNFIQTHGSCV